MTAVAPLPAVMTFAPMVDSELARLVLAHYGVAYEERDHLFGWVSLLTLGRGGYGRTPMLIGRGLRLSGPRPMAEHFDATVSPDRRLLPVEEPVRSAVEDHWNRYNGEMAFDVAGVAYYHLLPHREVMIAAFGRGLPASERSWLPRVYGALRGLFTLLLGLSEGHAADALARIRTRFAVADAVLGDGRPWLTGDRPTLADLALIAAAAPLLLPPGYGKFLPRFEEMPAALQAIVAELRGHRAAALVARYYADRPE